MRLFGASLAAAAALAIALLVGAPTVAQQQQELEICEVHVWAASNNDEVRPADRNALTAENKSWLPSILDASQRLYEIDAAQVRLALGLSEETHVLIHDDRMLLRDVAERRDRRLADSSRDCYYDWVFRSEGFHGPPIDRTILFSEHHGQMYYKSYFRQMSPDGEMIERVYGSHRAALPVISETDGGEYIYDTASGTSDLLERAAKKIKDKVEFSTNKGSSS